MRSIKEVISRRTINACGQLITVHETNDHDKPALVLLHGFPASSAQFLELMADLCDRFYLIAPDLPGFGLSAFNDFDPETYTFEGFSIMIECMLSELKIGHTGLFVQDCGGPVGFLLYQRDPELIKWLVVQNSNAYEAEFTKSWDCYRSALWINHTREMRQRFEFLQQSCVEEISSSLPETLLDDGYADNEFLRDLPESILDINLNLYNEYTTRRAFYNNWQSFLNLKKPKMIVFWEGKDNLFKPVDGDVFYSGLPATEVYRLNYGRLAVKIYHAFIAGAIANFYESKIGSLS